MPSKVHRKVERGGWAVFAVPLGLLGAGVVVLLYGVYNPPCSLAPCPTGTPCPAIACANPVLIYGVLLILLAIPAAIFAVLFHRSRRYIPLPS